MITAEHRPNHYPTVELIIFGDGEVHVDLQSSTIAHKKGYNEAQQELFTLFKKKGVGNRKQRIDDLHELMFEPYNNDKVYKAVIDFIRL